ncbi:MAG: ABC transporter ATP-binding protein, partial [Rhodoluna sp.]|nr:ABC transporter ATP-binding protein [Rhodoluna sp.]
MAAKTKKVAKQVSDKPVVVVDGVHIIYKVFASGRRATKAGSGGGLFSRKMRLREVHAVKGLSFTV